MYCEVPSELRQRMEQAGITIKAVCQRVKKPYLTIGEQLNLLQLLKTVRIIRILKNNNVNKNT